MPRRKTIIEGSYYHVFNRGVDKRDIFIEKEDIDLFMNLLSKLNKRKRLRKNKPFVEINAYALLPNHFHLILKPVVKNGISDYLQRVCTSYASYFNKKYDRSGALFQGRFKAKIISGELSLSTLSVYVNLNYKHHFLQKENSFVRTSFHEYLGEVGLCTIPNIIFDEVGGRKKYKKFAEKTEKIFIDKKLKKKLKKKLG